MKPLGAKAYGHIPHLPGSRMGPADHHCHEGQARIATVKTRDRHDVVIVQEKLDGSCCAVARTEQDCIMALGRAGYLAQSSKYEMHQLFAAWVREREDEFRGLLKPGERAVGEWMAQAHGTRYLKLPSPFVIFDLMVGTKRAAWAEVAQRVQAAGHVHAPVIHAGAALSIEAAMAPLAFRDGQHGCGHYCAMDDVEGAIWRVERKGEVDFIVKYVRPDKVDGCYLEQKLWNWRPGL